MTSRDRTAIFIAFEGGEGAGKTTQAAVLKERLESEGRPTLAVREPGSTKLGLHLREYLKSKQPLAPKAELLLFVAARAQLVRDEIEPALARGWSVIADRFTASSIAYQGHGRRISLDRVRALNDFAVGQSVPDLNILLDLPPEQGLGRVAPQMTLSLEGETSQPGREEESGQRRFEEERKEFHARVRAGYLGTARAAPDRWLILDGTQAPDLLADQVWAAVKGLG